MKRLLVTGTRYGVPDEVIGEALREAVERLGGWGVGIVLVHGDAPGVDSQCRLWWRTMGGTSEAHPADWRTYGKSAGPVRNQQMVDSGADLCYAFPRGDSRGTYDCIERARKAGIEVVVVDPYA